jgi:hypothetical protein
MTMKALMLTRTSATSRRFVAPIAMASSAVAAAVTSPSSRRTGAKSSTGSSR